MHNTKFDSLLFRNGYKCVMDGMYAVDVEGGCYKISSSEYHSDLTHKSMEYLDIIKLYNKGETVWQRTEKK